MTYASEIKQRLDSNTGPINAVIYARVSTDNEGQKESCANQVDLANKYVANHPNIIIMGTFVDDGISGKNDFTRPQYNAMLQLISEANIDLIITKAMSRLNRDEYNAFGLRNYLLQNQATVLTLEDNQVIDFEDMNAGILQSLTYAMDAQYVKRQSVSGRKTHELRCERKELSAKDCSYGYDWDSDKKTISINSDEAKIVVRIFENYVFQNGTPASIQKMLKHEGITISERTISNIIQDERYIGNFYINKRTSKLGTGQSKSQRIKLPKEQWILVERPDLQIIDNDLFEMAQRIHQTRITIYEKPDTKTTQAHFQGIHKYAGKIFCPICGKPYQHGYADRKKTIGEYRIRKHSACTNAVNRIYESDLEEITRQALQHVMNQQSHVYTALEEILIECVKASQNKTDEVAKLKKQMSSKENQINTLIDTLSEGGLSKASKDRIKTKINAMTAEIANLTKNIKDKESNTLSVSYVSDKIAEIKAAIANLRKFTVIDRNRILNYIERIELQPNGDVDILLKSGQRVIINTTVTSDFSGANNVVKTGIQGAPYSYSVTYPESPLPELPQQ